MGKKPRQPEDLEHLPYRRGVGILLLNRENEVFVAQRLDTRTAAWQMPQGGIDEGETPRDAALRELEEETGTAKAEIIAESSRWFAYDLPADLVPRVWGGRYRGQTQKWFVMRFLGANGDIDLETESPEFATWRWAACDQLSSLIVPFKRQLYREVLAEFASLLAPGPAGPGTKGFL